MPGPCIIVQDDGIHAVIQRFPRNQRNNRRNKKDRGRRLTDSGENFRIDRRSKTGRQRGQKNSAAHIMGTEQIDGPGEEAACCRLQNIFFPEVKDQAKTYGSNSTCNYLDNVVHIPAAFC